MSEVYLIKPLEKKSITWHIEAYRENADGSISWFNIEDSYRLGQGFVEADMDMNLPYKDDTTAYAKTNCGWGSELDDQVACWFVFSDDMSEEEQEEIKQAYHNGGAGWLFDGEHNWQIEDDYLEITAPFQVSLCDEDGTVIEENVTLKARPDPNTSWPWSTEFPKPKDEE